MNCIAVVNPERVTPEVVVAYSLRTAARAVVFDGDGRIALLHVQHHAYHKLPGGGIESGEDIATALTRECQEEIGCAIYIGESLGEVHEYRKKYQQHQISYCFTAQVQGEKGQPSFTAEEQAGGFAVPWYFPDEALMILESQVPTNYTGEFITIRDTAIVRTALKLRA